MIYAKDWIDSSFKILVHRFFNHTLGEVFSLANWLKLLR